MKLWLIREDSCVCVYVFAWLPEAKVLPFMLHVNNKQYCKHLVSKTWSNAKEMLAWLSYETWPTKERNKKQTKGSPDGSDDDYDELLPHSTCGSKYKKANTHCCCCRFSSLQIGKQAPYYVGASQTLPRGMYTDRNKVAMGEYCFNFFDMHSFLKFSLC